MYCVALGVVLYCSVLCGISSLLCSVALGVV